MNAPDRPHAALTLETLRFDNSFARLPAGFYTRLDPQALPAPYRVAFNPEAAALIGLDPAEAGRPEFVEYFGGSRVLPGAEPLAAIYAGHQFGVFVPQLGDGRAHLLGEAVGPDGRRWDLQLKGAGKTPYSRMGDGRAVLRSTIREYLASEAMHGLGIPTSRALAIIGSDAPVYREEIETAAVLTRMAPCHVRFGSFELFASRRQHDHLRTLADYVIREHYPELAGEPNPHAALLRAVSVRTARLVARWQAVGFCHGVMNTDNMSILGITIDYGPYGFLDGFDANHICNHSDEQGRYAWNQQPTVAHWNVSRLAQAMLPLMTLEEAQDAVDRFEGAFESAFAPLMREKLGLRGEHEADAELLSRLFALLQKDRADWTLFFRRLGGFSTAAGATNAPVRDLFLDRDAFDAWAADYAARLRADGTEGDDAARAARMNAVNPKYVLRNHMAETAIRKARDQRDYSEIETLRRLLARPFDEQPEHEAYAGHPPDWAGSLAVSCSS